MMEETIEHELCSNCKKEIPHFNYVMHTAHCQRNIALCPICKEPVPKNRIEEHKKKHHQTNGRQEDKENISGSSHTKPDNITNKNAMGEQKPLQPLMKQTVFQPPPNMNKPVSNKPMMRRNQGLMACKFCELELPPRDLEEHIVYCGSRTEKCEECGEHVMIKYQQIHQDSNHGFLKLKDEPGPIPSWEQKPRPERPKPAVTTTYSPPVPLSPPTRPPKKSGPKFDNTTEMVRRVDCKTEYIRNLLHETALQTVPIRSTSSTGAVPRHRKGPAPPPPVPKTMPPTEIKIPCEFCHETVDADDLVRHETGCRPDLARYAPKGKLSLNVPAKRAADSLELAGPGSPEVELPCEFCSSLFPASKLLRHQALCV